MLKDITIIRLARRPEQGSFERLDSASEKKFQRHLNHAPTNVRLNFPGTSVISHSHSRLVAKQVANGNSVAGGLVPIGEFLSELTLGERVLPLGDGQRCVDRSLDSGRIVARWPRVC